ncbi:MAG: TetR/AcrR family transcriptional regulator [Polyangiaceae bacterium]
MKSPAKSPDDLTAYRMPSLAHDVMALDGSRAESVPIEKLKKRRNSDETKKRILAAAESEFATKGFDGARLANIANGADVQQALIHHYFSDKAGLYREVIARALSVMSDQGWQILQRLAKPSNEPKVRELVHAFVGLVIEFYASHGPILSILRHEASATDDLALDVVSEKLKPVFDAVVAYTDELRRRGEIRDDVDARHLCVSTLALATITVQDQRLLRGMWPIDVNSAEFREKRKTEIIKMVLSRIELAHAESAPISPAPKQAKSKKKR